MRNLICKTVLRPLGPPGGHDIEKWILLCAYNRAKVFLIKLRVFNLSDDKNPALPHSNELIVEPSDAV
jgi:hypothetical protein